MDAFRLHKRIIQDYHDYATSFIQIKDERIDQFVRDELAKGALWPEPLLQLNPAYQQASTVLDLVDEGLLHPGCGDLFRDKDGNPFRLYTHQEQAIRIAKRHEPYVLTTGTGSGKSLTYLVPIVDHVLRHNPERHTVRAIIVYPMNALINSQLESIERLINAFAGDFPVRFARYTGQESDEEKDRIQQDPPHVLLTNYVMLELMLTRQRERVFVDRAVAELEFLAIDELHTYTGRQGADVSMLIRRLRERCGNPNLLCIGTSATMVAEEGSRTEQRRTVADVASTVFGVPVPAANIIDETIERATIKAHPVSSEELRQAVLSGVPEEVNYGEFIRHPLPIWLEDTFGVEADETGHLGRRRPIPLAQGAQQLAAETGLPIQVCQGAIEDVLRIGNGLWNEDDEPVFAYKLHQFISQGGAVYGTLESPRERLLTLEGRHYASEDHLLAPIVFCRVCGQEYYHVRLVRHAPQIEPLIPAFAADGDTSDARDGYLVLEDSTTPVWTKEREEELPDNWFNYGKSGRTSVKKQYRDFIPRRVYVKADGSVELPVFDEEHPESTQPGWFIPEPFLSCLSCGVVYTRKEREFRKLAQLSNEGRSTATTLLGISAVSDLREQPSVRSEAAKLLSFTDNRQDASLQAGHFNDFVQVALLRSAVVRALEQYGTLDHSQIAQCAVEALNLPPEAYAKSVSSVGRTQRINQEALTKFVEYRIYEDLRRGWRVVQPNLEQAGLMHIQFEGLAEVCADEMLWQTHPVLADAQPREREWASHVFLDHLRRELAISATCLQPDEQQRLMRAVNQALKYPWRFGDEDESEEELRSAAWYLLPGGAQKTSRFTLSLSAGTAIGRFLRSTETWPFLSDRIGTAEYEEFLRAFVNALVDASYLVFDDIAQAVQIRADSLLWRLGDGSALGLDPVRTRWMQNAGGTNDNRDANAFFQRLYQGAAAQLIDLEGREHTAQVSQEKRQQREELFRTGELECLFCSPTMELGVDISDLNVVHMRNVPPTPANYAQRSGRAGRSKEPALVVTNCAKGSAHDQYFFLRPEQMVSGAVAPPRMDLGNQELVEAHVHALWLAQVGLNLRRSITEIIDTASPGYPLVADTRAYIELTGTALQAVMEQAQRVLASSGLEHAGWYSDDWLWRVLKGSDQAFDAAFDRWRDMYAAAERQLSEAREEIEQARRSGDRRSVERARRRAAEADRQKDLLCNLQGGGDTDFYPYRYLASEGFLPGYNFPRLPIRAYIASGGDGEFVSRPRFLAVREFAPMNVVYHEGRKYRIIRSQSASGDLRERFVRAKLCQGCGYFHEGDASNVDLCHNCSTTLDASNSRFTGSLFEMTDVVTRPVERITCDEEERLREGYNIETFFRFNPGQANVDRVEAEVVAHDNTPLLHLTFGPSATLWRVNTGWKRDDPETGFSLKLTTGEWQRGRTDSADDESPDLLEPESTRHGIRLLVRDTRNILLIQLADVFERTEEFLASLQSALQQGIRAVFQVSDRELGAERIGEGANRAILIWEDAEGGLGILAKLLNDSAAMKKVAQNALAICHFALDGADMRPATEDGGGCAVACYDCLMSYTNQWDHPMLDRHLIVDALLALSGAVTQATTSGRDYDEHYAWLRERLDPASELERRFLDHLYRTKRQLPDTAQKSISDFFAQADFYYEGSAVCVFCDGRVHDNADVRDNDSQVRDALRQAGYVVVVIRYDRDLEQQISQYQDIFGANYA